MDFRGTRLEPPEKRVEDATLLSADRSISDRNVQHGRPFDLQIGVASVDEHRAQLHPAIWYVGICEYPVSLWYNPEHGHKLKGYSHMSLLFAGPVDECQDLEQRLVDHYYDESGFKNVLRGGEPAPVASNMCFVYVLGSLSGPLGAMRLHQKRHDQLRNQSKQQ